MTRLLFINSASFLKLWLVFILCFGILSTSSNAQTGNGAVRGSMVDADFLVPVTGVVLSIEGTGMSVITDSNGDFFINNLPPGAYTILASKDGYVRERRGDVVVTAGNVKELEMEITAEVVELDEFVVSEEEITDTTSVEQAITLRTELKTFTEVLGQQFITQTGASDAAKLLSKTTGINIADGKFVVVRGLNDRYNAVTLNSLRVPSSDPDRRAVALDLFPSTVIQDIRTTKTFLPDLNGESTGATINIVTKAVPSEDFAKFKIGYGYNSQATGNNKFLTYRGGGTGTFGTSEQRALPNFIKTSELPSLANVFPGTSRVDDPVRLERQKINNTLSPVMGSSEAAAPVDFTIEASLGHRTEFMGAPAGITIATDYSKKYLYNDDDMLGRYTFDPGSGEASQTNRLATIRSGQETMRAGLLISAGIELGPESEIIATYFFNRIAEDRTTLQYATSDVLGPTERDYRESLAYTERDLRVMQLAGNHRGDFQGKALDVQWAVAYNQSSQLEPDHRFVRGILDLANPDPNANGVLGNYQPVPGNPIVPEFQRLWRELYDENYTMRMDVVSDLFEGVNGESAKLKFGYLLDYSDRKYRADSFAYNRGAQNSSFPSGTKLGFPGATWGDVFLTGNQPVGNDLDGITGNGAFNNAERFLYLFRANDFEFYDASQMISAGHISFDVDLFPDCNIVFGARLETTDIKIQSSPIYSYSDEPLRFALLSDIDRLGGDDTLRQLVNAAFNGDVSAQNDPRILARSRADITAQHVLPAISSNWKLSEKSRFRAAVSQTVARPSFKEMAPVVFQNVETGDLFVGNTDLEMSTILNYDARWEWFPSEGSLIGFSFFAKHIDKPIELSQEGGNDRPILSRFVNAKEGVVYGLELEYQRDFSFIADELKSFSLGTNYSYIKSQATRTGFVGNLVDPATGLPEEVPSLFGENRRLQGQPDYIFNFNLTYDDSENPFGWGVFLNVIGPQLFSVGGSPDTPDVFQEPYTTLDIGMSYRINQKCKVNFRAQNLLNAEVKRYYDNKAQPLFSSRQTGIGYSLSMTFDW